MITSNVRLEVIRIFKTNMKSFKKREPEQYEIEKFLSEADHKIESINSQLKTAINKTVTEYLEEEMKNENNGY